MSALVCYRNLNNVHCLGLYSSAFATIRLLHRARQSETDWEVCPAIKCCWWMSLSWSWWGASKNSAVTLNLRNDMISIYQRSVRTNENKITLILSGYVMNGFIMSVIVFMAATRLDNSPQSFDVQTVHSLVPWGRPRRIRPQKTRLSQS